MAWSSCGLGLGLALGNTALALAWPRVELTGLGLEGWGLGLGTSGLVNIPGSFYAVDPVGSCSVVVKGWTVHPVECLSSR